MENNRLQKKSFCVGLKILLLDSSQGSGVSVEDLSGIETMEFTGRIMTDTSRLNRPIRQRYLLDCRRHKTRRAILAAFTALIFIRRHSKLE